MRRQIELLFQRTDGREISDARECANVRVVPTCKRARNVNVADEDEEKEEEKRRRRRRPYAMRVGRGAHRHKRASEKGSLFLI